MKKILLLIITILLVGCTNKGLNFKKIQERVLKTEVFGSVKELSKEELLELYDIDTSLAEEILYIESTDKNKVDTYIILKVKEEKIKEQIEVNFKKKLDNASKYNQSNAFRIENKLVESYKGYDIYIISDNNQKVLDAIKGIKKDSNNWVFLNFMISYILG